MKFFKLNALVIIAMLCFVSMGFSQTYIPNSSTLDVGFDPNDVTQLLVRPQGTRNNIGHYEFGTYGNIFGSSKWLAIGSAPAAAGASVYGKRIQWNSNFAVFNLRQVNASQRDLVVQWGGTTSNNRLLFEYASSPTGAASTFMSINNAGTVEIPRGRLILSNATISSSGSDDEDLRFAPEDDFVIDLSASPNPGFFVSDNGVSLLALSSTALTLSGTLEVANINNPSGNLRLNGRIQVGSVEYLEDTGGNTITVGSARLVPDVNGSRDLGSTTFRWRSLFATNGVIQTSDRRDKEKIKGLDYGLKALMRLRPVQYAWKNQPEMGTQMGLIAQEVQQVMAEVVHDPAKAMVRNEEGNLVKANVSKDARLGINYGALTPVLIKAVQEQQVIIENQKAELKELKAQMAKVLKKLKMDREGVDKAGKLFQNNPNPAGRGTSIGYALDNSVNKATITVYDWNGKPVKTYSLAQRGEGNLTIGANELKPGMYTYVLLVDGKALDTKRMIITE
ncbi:MAG TPA: hypothetical protein DCS93_14895 [Microscillaceae bacterium]|nr:hypothetical protein [Microscillaceae bacterium]